MKALLPYQLDALRWLSVNPIGYANEHTHVFVDLGFASTGKSRFALWTKITAEGQQYLDRMSSRGGRATTTPDASESRPLNVPRPAAISAKADSKAAPGLLPNAVRLRIGNKVTYYPISMYEALHGSKARVVTCNKLLKSYPVAASDADTLVPE